MIVKMSKYAYVVYHKEYESFLNTLKGLGVVHIRETKSIAEDEHLQRLLADRKRINTALRYLKGLAVAEKVSTTPAAAHPLQQGEGLALLERLEGLQEKNALLAAQRQTVEKELDYLSIWGDFSYQSLRELEQAGFEIGFFTCPTSKFDPVWGEQYNAFLVNQYQSASYFVTVTKRGTVIDIDADRPKMPVHDMAAQRNLLDQCKLEMKQIDEELKHIAVQDYCALEAFDRTLQNQFNHSNALAQADRQAADRLMLLEGWLPTEHAPVMEQALEQAGYFFQPLEIAEDDPVPVKLTNNWFSKLYEPITRMFALPKYSEFDPTPFFAPFFMLFFGLCFGDGGYGLLVLLGCTFLKRKVNPDFKPYLTLFQFLGLAALIVGSCTGSVFGVELAKQSAFASVKDYFVSSDNLMTFSIVIGLVQIVFGKTIAALKVMSQKGTKYGIAPIAWVFIILALACAFGLPMLNVHLPEMATNLFMGVAGVGLLVAFLYNSPGKNIFLNFGTGLWNSYNIASGLLGDTLSYIRLFAIGLTGSILGGVFNSLAVDMTADLPVVARVIGMLLILLIGHSINIALCTISSLVHPLRLIFVEYYKNAEFEGGGKEYSPFKQV